MTPSARSFVLQNWNTGEVHNLKQAIPNYFGKKQACNDDRVAENQVLLTTKPKYVELTLLGTNPIYVRRRADKRREFLRRNVKVILQPGDGFTLVMDKHLHVIRHAQGSTPVFESVENLPQPLESSQGSRSISEASSKRKGDDSISDRAPHPKKSKMLESAESTTGSGREAPVDLTDTFYDTTESDSLLALENESDERYARRLQAQEDDVERERLKKTNSSSYPSLSSKTATSGTPLYGGPSYGANRKPEQTTQPAPSAVEPKQHRSNYSAALPTPKRPSPSLHDAIMDDETMDFMEETYGRSKPKESSSTRPPPSDWTKGTSSSSSHASSPKKSTMTHPNNNGDRLHTQHFPRSSNVVSAPQPGQVTLPVVVASSKKKEEASKKALDALKQPSSSTRHQPTKEGAKTKKKQLHVQEVDDDSPPTNFMRDFDEIDDDPIDDNVLSSLTHTSPNKKKYSRRDVS